MATNVNELIFIKRIKKQVHQPAHGGAWKIAYADFVTAMMAFFLLMWLLNATTEDQRTAISNYFAPASVSISTSGSGGVLGGRSIDSEGAMNSSASRPGLILGVRTPVWGNADEESEDGEGEFSMSGAVAEHDFEGAAGSHMGTLDAHDQKQGAGSHLGNVEKNDIKDAKGEFLARAKKKGGPDDKPGTSNLAGPKEGADGAARTAGTAEERRANDSRYVNDARSNSRQYAQREQQRFDRTEAMLNKLFAQDPKLRPYRKNLKIEQIGAGMRIQILDSHKVEMFPLGSAEMEARTNEIMAKIAESIKNLPNKIAIVGHTDATPYAAGSGYSNWELSTDRAHASRRALIAAGLPESRISTVIGKAATEPLNKADPDSPVNRRISILLLREAPPAPQPGRSLSGGRRDAYSGLNRANPPPRRSPVSAPQRDSRATAPGGESDIDPFEGPLDKEEAAPSAPVEKKVEESAPAKEPAKTVKGEDPAAEVETPAPEYVEPVEDGEIIDNDLWLRL
jgi:chemotaxis protein MotB